MKRVVRNEQAGVALVTTVIVIAVLAVVAVAFMQSTSTDRLSSRTVANYYKAQLAAKAGLAEAMALIQQGAQDFTYVSGAEPEGNSYRTFIRPVNEANGAWQFDGAPVYLDSGPGGNDGAQLLLTGSLDEPGLTRRAAWKDIPIDNARPNETNRYAFWVDDAAGKQNLTWWGGGGDRGVVTDLADLKLALPGQDGGEPAPFPPAALNALSGLRTYSDYGFSLDGTQFSSRKANVKLPSVASLNLVAPGVLGDSMEKYYFTIASASGATTPVGKPKLNLAALRQHINNLNADQGPESARALLVDELLKEEPQNATAWGGGNLSWLAKSGKYTAAEQKQIVANIIDYLDDDLIPTTDSIESPTYFGVEIKMLADGSLRGHPLITMVGLGSVFNWSGANEQLGWLNATLLLGFIGAANPWSSDIPIADYELDAENDVFIQVDGSVSGGLLGDRAENYFLNTFNEELILDSDIPKNAGVTLPNPAKDLNFAGRNNLRINEGRQPKEIVFRDITYTINKFRLKFTDSAGRVGYAQILPQGLTVKMEPTTVTSPGRGTQIVYKFTRPDTRSQKDLHLAGDPRMNFTTGVWTNAESSGGDVADIPTPQSPVDVTAAVGPDWDGVQGMPVGSGWYTNTSVTNHLSRLSRDGMESIAELGYIWTGKPWQTLNLLATNSAPTADWNLLDYISAGRIAGGFPTAVLPLKLATSDAAGSMTSSLLRSGGFNVNTRKLPTVAAVLSNAPGLGPQAAKAMSSQPSASHASAYGAIAALVNEAPQVLAPNTTTKFAKEAAQRALANVAVNHSRIFTVCAAGEYRLGDSVSRAQLEADVFVGVDPATGDAIIQVIDQRFR